MSETQTPTDAAHERRAARARKRLTRHGGRSFWISTALVAIIDALGVWVLAGLLADRSWAVAAVIAVALVGVNLVYLNPRAQASRWLAPGLVLMLLFVVYPVLYTAYLSFTNYQTGNLLDRDQAIERLENIDIRSADGTENLDLAVYRNAAGDLALLVGGESTEPFLGSLRAGAADTEIAPAADLASIDVDLAEPPATIDDYELLSGLALTGAASDLEGGEVNMPAGGVARVQTLQRATLITTGKRFTYDAAADTLLDNQTGRTCVAGEGNFFCDDVPIDEVQTVAMQATDSTIDCVDDVCADVPLYAIDQTYVGWREVIGVDNYVDVLTDPRIRAPFLRVLVWNVVFAGGSVLLNFALGLGLAMALKNERMRGRAIYRSIYIVPYAMPAFLSILVWRGLLNEQFGKVNGLLNFFAIPDVNWLGSTSGAMVAIFLVNLWLGFPYMFLICSGALTSIPEDLVESARVDGAGPWQRFRMVVLPLLLISTAPLLIGAFAFNFNNFVLVYLLTNGGPPLTGYDVPVGSTDLLISFTFDLAAGAGRGNQYALSTAIIMLIFIVLATTSALSFRLTKKLEDIYD